MALLPRILIIDDLFGRTLPARANPNRRDFCGSLLLRDITGDEDGKGQGQRILEPTAQAVFCRGQQPTCAQPGDTIENDPESVLRVVRSGWDLRSPGELPWSLVLLDLSFYTGSVTARSEADKGAGMPEGRPTDEPVDTCFGFRLLEDLHTRFPDLPIVILSGRPKDEGVRREYNNRGARGFLSKDATMEELGEVLKYQGLIPDEEGRNLGTSVSILKALRSTRICAEIRSNVLFRGERGTGKGMLVDFLCRYRNRELGKRKEPVQPLVEINSAVLGDTLWQSELFGIKRKTATAVEERAGLIEKANHGDVFFDEIKDMPAQVQAGVLKVLQERQIMRVGARQSIPVDVRFLSATNIDIEALAAANGFRLDLLDRLRGGGTIHLPPLRSRPEDIPSLAQFFLDQAVKANAAAVPREITSEALEVLQSHRWPGNVRELENCISIAVGRNAHNDLLVPRHLDIDAGERSTAKSFPAVYNPVAPPPAPELQQGRGDLDEVLRRLQEFDFDQMDPRLLLGKLPIARNACNGFLASLLSRGIQRQLRPSFDQPDGKLEYSAPAKVLLGDDSLSGSEVRNRLRSILSRLWKEDPELIRSDPILDEIHKRTKTKEKGRKKGRPQPYPGEPGE